MLLIPLTLIVKSNRSIPSHERYHDHDQTDDDSFGELIGAASLRGRSA